MQKYHRLHLHGDNIVECERTVSLIRKALQTMTTDFKGPFGSAVCPSYQLSLEGQSTPLLLTLLPGFDRWNQDIIKELGHRGGTLRETPDMIITGVDEHEESPLLAIEFCNALPAGNQAWQRNGRAYSFGKASIPYLYIAELSGYELDKNRKRKAERLPNPAVPFSYLAFSLTQKITTLPVFETSPGADEASRSTYGGVFAAEALPTLIRLILLNDDPSESVNTLRMRALSFVEIKASTSRSEETLTPLQWQEAYKTLSEGKSLLDFLVQNAPLKWSKTAYIKALTATARSLINETAALAVGLTSSELPMCIVPRHSRPAFADLVEKLYPNRLRPEFLSWLRLEKHLAICWVMGFKPRGDDARPDRGLPPFTRMLIGEDEDLLTIVYGPASTDTWQRLENSPGKLLANGLWESILDASSALLIDSSTDTVHRHGYLRNHWLAEVTESERDSINVDPNPLRVSEHDVDTVVHLLLAQLGGEFIFEGSCNPPGGDWSGISLQPLDRKTELRWLTLPRVSKIGAKRPDHIFQFFIPSKCPIILCIESKETAATVEPNIGPRLAAYVSALLSTPASIQRVIGGAQWNHSTRNLNMGLFRTATAAACLNDSQERIKAVIERANADLIMCFSFAAGGRTCTLRLVPTTQLGAELAEFIAAIPAAAIGVNIQVTDCN